MQPWMLLLPPLRWRDHGFFGSLPSSQAIRKHADVRIDIRSCGHVPHRRRVLRVLLPRLPHVPIAPSHPRGALPGRNQRCWRWAFRVRVCVVALPCRAQVRLCVVALPCRAQVRLCVVALPCRAQVRLRVVALPCRAQVRRRKPLSVRRRHPPLKARPPTVQHGCVSICELAHVKLSVPILYFSDTAHTVQNFAIRARM